MLELIKRKIRGLLQKHPRAFFIVRYIYFFVLKSISMIKFQTGFSEVSYKLDFNRGLIRQVKSGKNVEETIVPSYDAEYQPQQKFTALNPRVKAVAYYLPQFHEIPENNEWWGEGFTEWVNTKKAKPLFAGHYQPREPHEDIGYYSLSDVNAIRKQAQLARAHGIHGFCIYYYWFHGKTLLTKPIDLLYENKDIDINYCLCWANESWSRTWEGREHDLLMEQKYSPEDDIEFIKSISKYLNDSRYIRVDGKPMINVYNVDRLPSAKATAQRWRKWCRDNGIGEIHLVATLSFEVNSKAHPDKIGFDAYAEFPPHQNKALIISPQNISPDNPFTGIARDYNSISNARNESVFDVPVYPGCTMGWDNTARKGSSASIFLNFSVDNYYRSLRKCIEIANQRKAIQDNFIFINAWNEWAEGTYLEPDKKMGYTILNTTSQAMGGFEIEKK